MTRSQEIPEKEHEVELHEERPVVQKETVAVERVAFGEESVTKNVQVTQEQIDTDAVNADSADRTPRR